MNHTITQTNHEASRIIFNEYDNYLSSKGATKSYLCIEEQIILNQVDSLSQDNRHMAIDLGCGTGRISMLISKYFKKIIGFDISDEMLSIAREKFYFNKPEFIQCNFNLGIEEYTRHADVNFICASFGVGSCIQNLDSFLDKSISMLTKNGKIILSLYNKNYHAITYNQKEIPFASILNAKRNLVLVSHGSVTLPIKVHTYTYKKLKSIVRRFKFSESEFYFLPTFSGLIKSDLLNDQDFFDKVIDVDRSLMQYKNTVSAPYILIALTK